eukprot:7980324-Lingulodinium_polyedra.AAC.1
MQQCSVASLHHCNIGVPQQCIHAAMRHYKHNDAALQHCRAVSLQSCDVAAMQRDGRQIETDSAHFVAVNS